MATKKLDYEHDQKGFEDALKLSVELDSLGQKKIAVLRKSEDIYLQRWKPQSSEVTKVVSPDGKNKLKGARRLLSATTPQFRVDRDRNNPDVEKIASKLEAIAGVIWSMSNHIQKVRLESELALSALLYDEMIVDIVCLEDVVKNIQDAYSDEKDKWQKARWEGMLERAKYQQRLTPYLIKAVSPMIYFPQYGSLGTTSMYAKVKRTVSQVKEHWGARALKAVGMRKDTETVTECMLLDHTFKYVWLAENKKEPIFADVHGMPMMQTVAVRVSGTNLFTEVADQYDPFLKTLAESGIDEMQNTILSAMGTNLKATLNAQWDFEQGQAGDTITIDHSQLLGVLSHPPGSKLKPFIKDILSQDVVSAIELFRGMASESTIYDTALGAGAGKNDPYGLVSLVGQSGRLPVVDVKEAMGDLGATVQETIMAWWKAGGKSLKVRKEYGNDLELSPSDIPDVVRFECNVDVNLPQDKLQMLNAGKIAVELGASQEWALSEFAGIENPDKMRQQTFKEQAWRAIMPKMIEKVMGMIEQRMGNTTPPAPNGAPSQNGRAQFGEGPVPVNPNNPQGPAEPTVTGGLPPAMAGQMPQMPQMPPNMQVPDEMIPPEMMTGGQ